MVLRLWTASVREQWRLLLCDGFGERAVEASSLQQAPSVLSESIERGAIRNTRRLDVGNVGVAQLRFVTSLITRRVAAGTYSGDLPLSHIGVAMSPLTSLYITAFKYLT